MTVYMKDQELFGEAFNWLDRDGNIFDFSTGWTFTAKICLKGTTTLAATKSAGIAGAATLPNIELTWSATDFDDLPSGRNYVYFLYATRASDGKDAVFRPDNPPGFTLLPAPASGDLGDGDGDELLDGGGP